jgi:hypothetical protein
MEDLPVHDARIAIKIGITSIGETKHGRRKVYFPLSFLLLRPALNVPKKRV